MDLFLETIREALRLLMHGNASVVEIVALSLRVSGLATVLAVLIGMPLGALVGVARHARTLRHGGIMRLATASRQTPEGSN